MKFIILIMLTVNLVFSNSSFLKKEHMKELTTDFGVITCYSYMGAKLVVLDVNGDFYYVNGKAKTRAKMSPAFEWRDAKMLLKPNGNHLVFGKIIRQALKKGCSPMYR